MYINCHSYYSLRYGTMSVEQLVQNAVAAEADTIALTDINNSTAMPEFVAECNKHNIKPVTGIEFRNGNDLLYIGIAANNRGIRELNEFLTENNINGVTAEFPAPQFNDSYVVYSLGRIPDRKLYDNEFIGIRPGEVNSLLTMQTGIKKNRMVILHPVTFSSADDIFIHKNLRAVDNNILLSHLRPYQCAGDDEIFRERNFFTKVFSAYPEIIENTSRLIGGCNISPDLKSVKNKQ